MMKFNPLPFALVAFVAACDNDQPFIFAEDEEGPVAEGDGSIEDILDEDTEEVDLDDNEESRGDIVRLELRDLETGAGFAEDFTLDGDEDTLTIDNLAFDGFNVYTRGANTPVPKLSDIGTIAVYHGDETVPDFLTGAPVPQFVPHVALYEESAVTIAGDEDGDPADQPRTSFAIVRTGTFSDIPSPGGFVYQRAGDVVLPDTGQATFSGDYGALRIYDELDQLEIIEGDITINIDFDDFNELDGVAGVVTNRQAFDQFGNAIPTTNEIDRVGLPADVIQLPPVVFDIRISGESIAEDGEISGEVESTYVNPQSGLTQTYEEGEYFAIIAGDTTAEDGGEVVGVIVTESPDSRYIGVTAQETGGFIAKR